ncbi:MAG: DUF4037 domain-containing protein [Parasporobacterium sp.]|nr:DUF4037 domain-containing protein [Parasporobacterium sp.]
MKGLELSREFFEEYGKGMLEEFAQLTPYLAVGLTGSGSECFGYDDETSQDHDFEPGFCIFLPGEEVVDRKSAFLLERAYARLPKEFKGYRRSAMQPVGGARHGVLRIPEFLQEKTGSPDGVLSPEEWMRLPGYSLAEATNGEIFFDNYGELTRIRASLAFYPEDVFRKKLAGHLLLMAQSGQYNYQRCLRHGEAGAAQLAVFEFAVHTMEAIFLLNRRYAPYYKWSFRALREQERLSIQAELLEYLITTDNQEETAEEKYNVIEGIAADLIEELMEQDLTKAVCGDLEKHAYSVNDSIADPGIRNLHILAAV